MGRRVLANSLLLLVLIAVPSRAWNGPRRQLVVECEPGQRDARLRRREDGARPRRAVGQARGRRQAGKGVAIRAGEDRRKPRGVLAILWRRRGLGLVPREPAVLLEHGAELDLVLGQFGVEEALLLPDLLILHALLFYLLRRQHVLSNRGKRPAGRALRLQ